MVVPGGWGAFLIVFGLGGMVGSCFTSTDTSSAADGTGTPVTTTRGDCGGGTSWVWVGGLIVVAVATLLVPFVLLHVAGKRARSQSVGQASFAPVRPEPVHGG